MPGQHLRKFTDARRPGIFCKRKKEQVLEGQVRNWKTAHARTAPQKIYGRKAAGNFLQKKKRTGAGRVSAELE